MKAYRTPKVLKMFVFTVYFEDFFLRFGGEIMFYKYMVEIEIMFLWFDIFFSIGSLKNDC